MSTISIQYSIIFVFLCSSIVGKHFDQGFFLKSVNSVKNVSKRLRDSILSPFFHSYIFAMYKNEALWI
jgi:hypothetical protein